MIRIRRAEERGQADHGWLKTSHTFSFAGYRDPEHVHFRNLRVINEDYIAGGQGFGTHPHRDMEIITYVMEGALKHKDSLGNEGVIKPGIVQRMSAGTGIQHSEFNPLPDTTTHLYQIWIFPREKNLQPGWEEKELPGHEEAGKLVAVATPDGEGGALTMQADAKLFAAKLEPGQGIDYELPQGHGAWLQVTRGAVKLNGETLNASDGAAIEDVANLHIEADGDAEILLFDLQ
jgi:redox-sensitive bicupin YhaK (pirin superfamily)